MIASLLWGAVLFLAFANGANDNPKGVATLRGSGLAGSSTAILWGTVWTLAGALFSIRFGRSLIALFNGQGLLQADTSGRPDFLLAVGLAAGGAVLFASRIGAPISTTHALIGALVGTGWAAFGLDQLHLRALGGKVVLPLLFSPLLSLGLTLLLFFFFAPLRRFSDACVCLIRREPALISSEALTRRIAIQPFEVVTGAAAECAEVEAAVRSSPLNLVHWFSGGLMSLSRGLNDTPKIAALLLGAGAGGGEQWAVAGIAVAMALGGMVGSRRVSLTLSEKITPMDPVQGASANLVTSLLVAGAARFGLPVSTTHVACGSLFGIGLARTKETDWRQVFQIVLAWGITLPAAALLGGALYFLLKFLL